VSLDAGYKESSFTGGRRGYKSTPKLVNTDGWYVDSVGTWWEGRSERDVFPTKKSGFDHKINLWFKDVWHDAQTYFAEVTNVIACDERFLGGMSNDEATGWLIWLISARATLGSRAYGILGVLRHVPQMIKDINTRIKSLGLQSEEWGPAACELGTLMGRGVSRVEPWEDIKFRVDHRAFKAQKGVYLDADKLRECVREVVREELAASPEWHATDEYWSRRWMYTKAGAHSRYPEELWFGERLNLPDRPTRREASEEMKTNLVALGEPRVDAGFSEKLEHGKTRAIYSCDTRSYFTFDYLLKPVEAVWRNSKVLLDPGREPQCAMYRRLGKRGGYKYMLDFDDFNSQHTLEALKICIEEACAGAPQHVLDWAVSSWDAMFVHWSDAEGMHESRMVGTLPSGHRATSFVNTILNAAYCRYACGSLIDEVDSYHCGDDVIMLGRDDRLSKIVVAITKSSFRVNASKQSVGRACGEFLRVSFTRAGARGYLARAVSSLVSGNWVSETRLDKRAYVETMARGFWTICSRGRVVNVGALGKTSLERWVPELQGRAYDILTHRLSLDGTPCRARYQSFGVSVLRVDGGRARPIRSGKCSGYATRAFMENHVDFKLLKAAGVSPKQLYGVMLDASRKPRKVGEVSELEQYFDRSLAMVDCSLQALINKEGRTGKGKEEAFQLLRGLYKDVDWRRLVAIVRGTDDSSLTIDGKSAWPVFTEYELPFSDCMRLRNKLSWATQIGTDYPVRV
jgi:hypothetical protein